MLIDVAVLLKVNVFLKGKITVEDIIDEGGNGTLSPKLVLVVKIFPLLSSIQSFFSVPTHGLSFPKGDTLPLVL